MSSLDVDVGTAEPERPDRTVPRPGHLETVETLRDRAPVVRIGLLGYGRVGQAVVARAAAERGRLIAAGVDVRCVTALVRDPGRPRSGPPIGLTTKIQTVCRAGVDLIIEVLGGEEPARTLVTRALRAGLPVVSANKTLVARHGLELAALAARQGVGRSLTTPRSWPAYRSSAPWPVGP